jgi:hypothetical protein
LQVRLEEALKMDFKEFIDCWVKFCEEAEQKGLGKQEKQMLKGDEFERLSESILKMNIDKRYKVLPQRQIKGFRNRFDFVVIGKKTRESSVLDPAAVVAVIEVKSHGFFGGYKKVDKLKELIVELKSQIPKIIFMYITFRETNRYDEEIRFRLGGLIKHYYRLADSGDGQQIEPKGYFPENWDRMIADLKRI